MILRTTVLIPLLLVVALAHPLGVRADEGTLITPTHRITGPAITAAAATLVTPPIIRAGFREEKRIKGFARPVTSEGRFVFARELGAAWVTTSPVASVSTVSPAGIFHQDAGGSAVALSPATHPAIRIYTEVFLALFSGQLELLEDTFSIYYAPGPRWRLGLVPHRPKILPAITLEGARYAESLTLTDPAGDTTLLTFRNQETPHQLAPEETALFTGRAGDAP